jgi:hypothetical protein
VEFYLKEKFRILDNQKYWIKDQEKNYKDLKVLVKANLGKLKRKDQLSIGFMFEFVVLKINNLCDKVRDLRSKM